MECPNCNKPYNSLCFIDISSPLECQNCIKPYNSLGFLDISSPLECPHCNKPYNSVCILVILVILTKTYKFLMFFNDLGPIGGPMFQKTFKLLTFFDHLEFIPGFLGSATLVRKWWGNCGSEPPFHTRRGSR